LDTRWGRFYDRVYENRQRGDYQEPAVFEAEQVAELCADARGFLEQMKNLSVWQVSGRSDLDFDDMVRLDRYYLDNWSVRTDLQIILKTFLVVVGHKGAY
jgi:hypothetical protein